MFPLDIIGYIIGFCPAAVALKFLCCCKRIEDSFVWGHITYIQNAHLTVPTYTYSIPASIGRQLYDHRHELTRFDTFRCFDSSSSWLNDKERLELFATLTPRARIYEYQLTASDPVPKLNGSILKRLYLIGSDLESSIAVISSTRLPHLEVLHVWTGRTRFRHEERVIKTRRRELMEVIARNTGGLTHFKLQVSWITRPLISHLREVALSNPYLLVLDFATQDESSTDASFRVFVGKLSPLVDGRTSIELDQETWSTLPAQVQSCLGIPISCLKFNGHTICYYFLDDFFSHEWPLSTLQTLWTAVYSRPCDSSFSELMSFKSFFIDLVTPPSGLNCTWKQAAEWIVDRAAHVFSSDVPQLAAFEECTLALFGVINFASHFGLDSHPFVQRAFELASVHRPGLHPLSPLVLICNNDLLEYSNPREEHNSIVRQLVDFARAHHAPLKLFEDADGSNGIGIEMLDRFPEGLLVILKDPDAFDVNEKCVRHRRTGRESSLPGLLYLLEHIAEMDHHLVFDNNYPSRLKLFNRIFSLAREHCPKHSDWTKDAVAHLFEEWARWDDDDDPPPEYESLVTIAELEDPKISLRLCNAYAERGSIAGVSRLMVKVMKEFREKIAKEIQGS